MYCILIQLLIVHYANYVKRHVIVPMGLCTHGYMQQQRNLQPMGSLQQQELDATTGTPAMAGKQFKQQGCQQRQQHQQHRDINNSWYTTNNKNASNSRDSRNSRDISNTTQCSNCRERRNRGGDVRSSR